MSDYPHKTDLALQAVVDGLNAWREAAIAQSFADFLAENGVPSEDIPADGPVIPKARLDDPHPPPDPSNEEFEGRSRALRVFRGPATPFEEYGEFHVIQRREIYVEWILMTTREASGTRYEIFNAGLINIRAAFLDFKDAIDPETNLPFWDDIKILRDEPHTDDIGGMSFTLSRITFEVLLNTQTLLD